MTKKEILALESEALRIKALELFGWTNCNDAWNRYGNDFAALDLTQLYDSNGDVKVFEEIPDWPNDIGAAITDLFESVYGRGGKIKGGAWVLGTVDGGRDVASATLLWKAQSGQKHRANKVTVIRPRGEMAKAITQCWVCAMLGVSDVSPD